MKGRLHERHTDFLAQAADRMDRRRGGDLRHLAVPDWTEGGGWTRQRRRQHLFTLGNRARWRRRNPAAAQCPGNQEYVELAGAPFVRRRPGDRRAACQPSVRRVDPHATQGRSGPAGAAEVVWVPERTTAGVGEGGEGAADR